MNRHSKIPPIHILINKHSKIPSINILINRYYKKTPINILRKYLKLLLVLIKIYKAPLISNMYQMVSLSSF